MEEVQNEFSLVGIEDKSASENIVKPALSTWQSVWHRLRKNKLAVVSLVFLVLVMLYALISTPIVSQNSANQFDTNTSKYKNLPPKSGLPIPGWDGKMTSPGATESVDIYEKNGVDQNYLLGTDNLGRSVAKRVTVGLRISLFIAIVATAIDLLIGVSYGLVSGWVGGWVDTIMQRIIEVISAIPNLVVVTLLAMLFGSSIWSIILAIALTSWTGMARQVRNLTLTYKERDFVLAAKTLGESGPKIALKHLVPNMSGTIIVQIMMTIPAAIMFEAVLSAINLGVKAPTASLGTLITDGQNMLQYYPYQILIPSVVLVLVSLAFILLGDGLRDAFDPKMADE
ncbi:ABC transporter permease [Fructobacillus evanidus]|uniref:Permease component (DppC) n=1 Tax=Fructobacillus evanidus TaxID=3064281 RepID=A0ABM9N0U5_9LACO|nr:ABC-type dipeptide/oligopeptide/nickel transport system [Fructobacillus sp. LMG 32999]CAK1247419.1 ABC-type dipeptide/oligopeptide/nickel transport system [Fructobacillus sp. LMG 32999]CAK1251856.1 ABC-type dipeptide/oligopeptide/nickel transport system [Fructobacillus sp. LMG 32999]CAK1251885.1 ABC-type dipeptide/oligopeptide/nickel transport system [Fructobacillus sp. LMG 32999]CAK1252255.1 ABC-type dipeptide/oligopeptide/nickel transport system [Fructobacillus sp. LMG 32999]